MHGHPRFAQGPTHLAAAAPPFVSLIDPNNNAFLSPVDMVTSINDYCTAKGEPVPACEGAYIRCALESLALKYRSVLEGIEKLTGEKIEVIHVVGGGSKNDLLNQFTANACHRPVIAGPTEATAYGNVLIQARAAGDIGTLSQIREVVKRSSGLRTFQPEDSPQWTAAYERFLRLRG